MKISSKKRPHPSKYAGISPNVLLKRRYMIASTEDKKRDLDCKNIFFTKIYNKNFIYLFKQLNFFIGLEVSCLNIFFLNICKYPPGENKKTNYIILVNITQLTIK